MRIVGGRRVRQLISRLSFGGRKHRVLEDDGNSTTVLELDIETEWFNVTIDDPSPVEEVLNVAFSNETVNEEFVETLNEEGMNITEMVYEGFTVGEPPDAMSWGIDYDTVTTSFGDKTNDKEIQVQYNISVQEYEAVLYEVDCTTPVNSSVIGLSDSLELVTSSLGILSVDLDVNQARIKSNGNGVWSDDGREVPLTGNIQFCVRVDLIESESNLSVNFDETIFNITIDMTKGFEVIDIATDRDVATNRTEDADINVFVEAYQCDPDNLSPVSTTMRQGSILSVCIKTNSSNYYVGTITSFNMTQENSSPVVTEPIDDGTVNDLTSLDCSKAPGVCIIRTQMISSYFRTANPGDLNGIGTAVLGFGSPPSSRRLLQEQVDTTSSFGVQVPLESSIEVDVVVDESVESAAAVVADSSALLVVLALLSIFAML